MEQALHIPLDAVEVETNTFGDKLMASDPFEACCFPFAQHCQTTSFPASSPIRTREDLETAVQKINADPQ